MRLRIVAITTGALVASAGAFALAAGPPPSITGGVLGSGVLTGRSSTAVQLSHRNGFVMENATVPAGATFGWHYHRTAVVVAVTAGTLTLYDSSGPKCTPHRYRAGQGFIEPANHVHMARNQARPRPRWARPTLACHRACAPTPTTSTWSTRSAQANAPPTSNDRFVAVRPSDPHRKRNPPGSRKGSVPTPGQGGCRRSARG